MKVTTIIGNYTNGNITDFRKGLQNASKKDLLLITVHLAELLSVANDYENKTYSDNGYCAAIEIIYKYL